VEAGLLESVASPGSSIEIYDFRLYGSATQRSSGHSAGTREHLHLYSGYVLIGPAVEPVELSAGEPRHVRRQPGAPLPAIGRADVRGSSFITHSDA
jgi:hypothetical protein